MLVETVRFLHQREARGSLKFGDMIGDGAHSGSFVASKAARFPSMHMMVEIHLHMHLFLLLL